MLKTLVILATVTLSATVSLAANCESADAAIALFAKVHPIAQENTQVTFKKDGPTDRYTILFTKGATVQKRARIGEMTILKADCSYVTFEEDSFSLRH